MTTLEVARFKEDNEMETIMTYKAKDYPHNIWFTVSLCLPRGEYKLVFIGTLGLAPLNSLAIDSISLLSTTCQSPMTNKSGKLVDVVDCDFNDAAFCGFKTSTTSAFIEWMAVKRDQQLNVAQTFDQLYCDANFSYPVGIVQSPLFPYKLYPCSMCEYTIDGSDDGSRTFQWQYFNVGNYQDGDSGLGIKTTSSTLQNQLENHFKSLANPPSLNSNHIEGCGPLELSEKTNLTADDTIAWISEMVSLPKTEDIGTGKIQMLLYTSRMTSGDGFRIRYETKYPELAAEDRMLVLAYIGYSYNVKQHGSLLSPKVTFSNPKCLTMVYLSSYSFLLKAVINTTMELELFEGLDTGGSWSTVHFLLDSIPYGMSANIRLEMFPDSFPKVLIGGIKRFTIENKSCRYLDFGSSTVTCDFETDCGYTDESAGNSRWITYNEKSIEGSGNDAYMKAVLLSRDHETTARLVSPPFQLSADSCVSFRYNLKTIDLHLSVVLEEMETRTAAVSSSTAIPFDVVPHGWKNAGLNLDGEGWRRLVFVAGSEGGGYLTARQVYLDDVKLAEKPCIQENASETVLKENTVVFHSIGNANDRLLNKVGSLDVQSLNRMLGHQKEQMLIECTWQGSTCQNDSLSHTYTDKGYCFTFNFNESNILKTTETGAEFGVRMLLNIEQYEYTKEYSTDAGVRIHLHTQSDIARMKDLAFAVEPGSHSMASVKYQYSSSLPFPWGNCTTKAINFFEGESYTQSKCKLNHETDDLIQFCGCKNIQMPGSLPLCNISTYIICLRDVEHNAKGHYHNRSCPDACVVKTHSVELSSSLISGLSAEKLLSLYRDDIERRYFNAAEYRFRVTQQQTIDVLERLQDTFERMEHYRSYLKTDVFASGTSVISRVQNAVIEMDKLVNSSIYDQMFKEIGNYMTTYTKYKEPSFKTIRTAYGEIIAAMTAFGDMLLTYNYENKPEPIENQYQNLLHTRNKLLSTVDEWAGTIEYYHAKKPAKGRYFPRYTTSSSTIRKICNLSRQFDLLDLRMSVVEVFNDIEKVNSTHNIYLFDFEVSFNENCYEDLDVTFTVSASGTVSPTQNGKVTCKSKWANHTRVVNLYRQIQIFQNAFRRSEMCYFEYGNFLSELNIWLEGAGRGTEEQFEDSYNFMEMTQDIAEAGSWLYNLIQNLMLDKMRLVDVAREVRLYERDRFALKLENVKEIIFRLVITPIQKLLEERESSINQRFMKGLVYDERFSSYFSSATKDMLIGTARRLPIWKKPIPNLDSPKIITYTLNSLDTWKVWPDGKTFHTFVKDTAKTTLTNIFENYYGNLKSEIHNLNSELNARDAALRNSFAKLKDGMEIFLNTLVLDDKFVMKNILKLDIYFGELKYEKVEQQKGYDVGTFFSDVGGYMGLLIGGSAITICELLDLVILNSILKYFSNKKTTRVSNFHYSETSNDDLSKNINKQQTVSTHMT